MESVVRVHYAQTKAEATQDNELRIRQAMCAVPTSLVYVRWLHTKSLIEKTAQVPGDVASKCLFTGSEPLEILARCKLNLGLRCCTPAVYHAAQSCQRSQNFESSAIGAGSCERQTRDTMDLTRTCPPAHRRLEQTISRPPPQEYRTC
jgi:hypothetical protein